MAVFLPCLYFDGHHVTEGNMRNKLVNLNITLSAGAGTGVATPPLCPFTPTAYTYTVLILFVIHTEWKIGGPIIQNRFACGSRNG